MLKNHKHSKIIKKIKIKIKKKKKIKILDQFNLLPKILIYPRGSYQEVSFFPSFS